MRYVTLAIVLASFLLGACQDNETVITPEPIGKILGRRQLGLNRTPPERLAKIKLAEKSSFNGKLPTSFNLKMPPPEPTGQANEGACVAWATAYAARSFYQDNNFINPDATINYSSVFSPEYVYNQIRISSDCEKGAYFVTTDKHLGALDLLVEQGVCLWKDMPYTDVSCKELPNPNQKALATGYRIASYAKVEGFSTVELKKMLLKQPILVGVNSDDGFENANAQFIWKSPIGNKTSGHATVVIGFDDAKNAFKILNSWGNKWGDQGYSWLDYGYYNQVVFEAYILAL
ncbi:C1 family peptidase [Haliscomenobacter sp.]|uniref:C1 family peptidase n=1 Tax=Haliscomenobacter sp. TaxID=2717303 RepID=UPI003364EB2F